MAYQKFKALTALVKPLKIRYAYQAGKPYHKDFFEEVKAFSAKENIELSDKFYLRLSKYIINILPVFEWFAALRNREISNEETLAGLFLAGFIPLYDDLNDDEGYTHEQIMAVALGSRISEANTTEEILLKYFYEQSQKHFGHPNLFEKYLEMAGASQDESLEQMAGTLSREDLMRITTEKGGASLLFLRSALTHSYERGEEEAVFALGQFIQLMDDTFDTHKDTQAGIVTIPNSSTDVSVLRQLLISEYAKVEEAFNALSYPKSQIHQFIYQLRFFTSTLWVCLDQFEALQKTTGNVFTPKSYSRGQLICDMEKLPNMWSSFRYGWKGIR
ncbi:MAG: hypothetical protein SchgKO_14750 [Schleiferiaceae bacterium]